MRRDRYQKRAYALRRLSRAVDRLIVAATPEQKAHARRWAALWNRAAKLHARQAA